MKKFIKILKWIGAIIAGILGAIGTETLVSSCNTDVSVHRVVPTAEAAICPTDEAITLDEVCIFR